MTNNIQSSNYSFFQKAQKIGYIIAFVTIIIVMSYDCITYIKDSLPFLLWLNNISIVIILIAFVLFLVCKQKYFRLSYALQEHTVLINMSVTILYEYGLGINIINHYLFYSWAFIVNIILIGICLKPIHILFANLIFIATSIIVLHNPGSNSFESFYIIIFGIIETCFGLYLLLYHLNKSISEDLSLRKKLHEKETQLLKEQTHQLNKELEYKQKELTINSLNLLKQVECSNCFNRELQKLKTFIKKPGLAVYHQVLAQNNLANPDAYWLEFEACFREVHNEFYTRLQNDFPELTQAERRLAALIRLGLSTKQIAGITNNNSQSVDVARSRLRKKLNLETSTNLSDYLINI